MDLTQISKELNTSKQNISQIASRGIKKLFKNIRLTYNLSYLETYEMMLIGLDVYKDDYDVKYLYNNLSIIDKSNIEKERIKYGKNF